MWRFWLCFVTREHWRFCACVYVLNFVVQNSVYVFYKILHIKKCIMRCVSGCLILRRAPSLIEVPYKVSFNCTYITKNSLYDFHQRYNVGVCAFHFKSLFTRAVREDGLSLYDVCIKLKEPNYFFFFKLMKFEFNFLKGSCSEHERRYFGKNSASALSCLVSASVSAGFRCLS